MRKMRVRLGVEHPYCDTIQLTILILYFVVWGTDVLGHFVFNISTILVSLPSFPLLVFAVILSIGLGVYLTLKSHEAVFDEIAAKPKLIDSGVYSKVRHPMYLGILMFCLGFLFVMFSLLSLGIWVIFFIFYDMMATFEEKDIIRKLGDQYVDYKKHVGKWFPKL